LLQELVTRFARRDQSRTEAEVQADIRQFILSAPFELDEGDVEIVSLEAQVGGGRRIDVEVGSTVIEVKRDLRRGRVREEAKEQLGGYVAHRAAESGRLFAPSADADSTSVGADEPAGNGEAAGPQAVAEAA
jgi:RecB family endonuclease NucS